MGGGGYRSLSGPANFPPSEVVFKPAWGSETAPVSKGIPMCGDRGATLRARDGGAPAASGHRVALRAVMQQSPTTPDEKPDLGRLNVSKSAELQSQTDS